MPVYVGQHLFLGHADFQQKFRDLLKDLAGPVPDGVELPAVVLVSGGGGMGKTLLLRRLDDIARLEPAFSGLSQSLWLDWRSGCDKFAGFMGALDETGGEALLDALYAAAVQAWDGRFVETYRQMQAGRVDLLRQVEKLVIRNERSDLSVLRTANPATLSRVLQAGLSGGGKMAKTLQSAGLYAEADQAKRLPDVLLDRLQRVLRPDQIELLRDPVMALAHALGKGLREAAAQRPLLVFLDPMERVERGGEALYALMQTAGPQVAWLLAGHTRLSQPEPMSRAAQLPAVLTQNLIDYVVPPLDRGQVRDLLQEGAPGYDFSARDVEQITDFSQGIPMAVVLLAGLFQKGASLSDVGWKPGMVLPSEEVLHRVVDRTLTMIGTDEDRPGLFALALAGEDMEALRSMLVGLHGVDADTARFLDRVSSLYPNLFDGRRLGSTVAALIENDLQEKNRLGDPLPAQLARLGAAAVQTRLERAEHGIQKGEGVLASRSCSEAWICSAAAMTRFAFWVDEALAWSWIFPRMVEGLAYNRDLCRELLQVIRSWRANLSAAGQQYYPVIAAALSPDPSVADEAGLLSLLQSRVDQWAQDGFINERLAILDWLRGQNYFRQGMLAEAMTAYKKARTRLPEDGGALRGPLATSEHRLARFLLWPNPYHDPNPTLLAETEDLLHGVLAWLPDHAGASYDLGMLLLGQGKPDLAVPRFERALARDPAYANAENALGVACLLQGDPDRARPHFAKAIQIDPTLAEPHVHLGDLLLNAGKTSDAQEHYRLAADFAPFYAAPYTGLGKGYLKVGKLKEAEAAFHQSLVHDDTYAEAHTGLGNVFRDRRNLSEAAKEYLEAIRLTPGNAVPHYNLAEIYTRMGRPAGQAILEYQRAIGLDAHYAAPHNGLGTAYRTIGKTEDAIKEYRWAILLDPAYATPYGNLGDLFVSLGNYDEAIQAYQSACKYEPDNPGYQQSLASLYRQTGQLEESSQAYRAAVLLDPSSRNLKVALADVLAKLGNLLDAELAYREALRQDGNNPDLHTSLGEVLLRKGDQTAAERSFQEAVRLAPRLATAHKGLGDLYAAQGKNDQAVQEYQRAISSDPVYAAAYFGLGTMYARRQKPRTNIRKAIAAFQMAGELGKGSFAEPYNGLGDLYLRLGQVQQAVAVYRRAIEISPKSALPHNGLGNAYLRLNRRKEAISAYSQAAQLDPGLPEPYRNLGNIYLEMGRYHEAADVYRRADRLQPKQALVKLSLGKAYAGINQLDDAMSFYKEAALIDPTLAAAQDGLGMVYLRQERFLEAETAFRRAFTLDARFAAPHKGMGDIHMMRGNTDMAVEEFKQAIELDPEFVAAYQALVAAYRRKNEFLAMGETRLRLMSIQARQRQRMLARSSAESNRRLASRFQGWRARLPEIRLPGKNKK